MQCLLTGAVRRFPFMKPFIYVRKIPLHLHNKRRPAGALWALLWAFSVPTNIVLLLDRLALFSGHLRGAGNSLMTRYAHEEILFLGALRGLIYSYWAALVSRPGAALMGAGGLPPPVGSFWYRDIKMTCLRRHCRASYVYTQAMLANLRCARLPPRRGDLVRFSLALAFFSRCSSVNTMGLELSLKLLTGWTLTKRV